MNPESESPVTGYKKFVLMEKIAAREGIRYKKIEILDLGGVTQSFKILKKIFPNAIIYTFNSFQDDMVGCENPIKGDAENLSETLKNKTFDAIFATDVMEHLTYPDSMLEGCHKHLREKGHLFITTPNMACWYNRLFLLFGLSPPNYHPSVKYRVGNPFVGKFIAQDNTPIIKKKSLITEHKSVFTYGGLKELIKIYNFKIVNMCGFDYSEHHNASGRHGVLRVVLNKILPNGMKEGILVEAIKS